MKLTGKDFVDEVYFTYTTGNNEIEYHDHKLDLYKIKLAKRDGKGTKIRM